MGNKRKRSDDDDSPLSVSSCGSFAPTPEGMDIDASAPTSATQAAKFDFGRRSWGLAVTRVDGSDLGSRTRKRFRDNRPDEKSVHGTLDSAPLRSPYTQLVQVYD